MEPASREDAGEIIALERALAAAEEPRERARLLNLRGCVRFRAGERVAAEADFEAALAADPECVAALNNRACLRAHGGDLARAQIDLTRALAGEPRLAAAQANHRLIGQVRGLDRPLAKTTLSQLDQGAPDAFCEALVSWLEGQVSAPRGFEDCRQDAIAEVVTRVLSRSRERDLPLRDSLRELRRSSTRGWVRSLIQRFRQRGGEAELEGLPAREPAAAPEALLRLDELFARVREQLLARSRPSTRRRRRVLWGVYLDALAEGVQLSRAEAIAAARELGLGLREVSDRQLDRDLDVLSAGLREAGPPGGAGRGPT